MLKNIKKQIFVYYMVHILGKKLPLQKKMEFNFTSFYGIGHYKNSFIVRQLGINKNKKGVFFAPKHFTQATSLIEKDLLIEDKLKRDEKMNIQRLISISAYRGIRHVRRLPVRGQRTHTNAKTCKRQRKISFVSNVIKKGTNKKQITKKKKLKFPFLI